MDMHHHSNIVLNGSNLTFEQAIAFALGNCKIELDKDVKAKVEANREAVIASTKSGKPVYGFTRGFGQNQDVAVSDEGLIELQKNLIRTHSISFGRPTIKQIAKMAMLFRANALSKGHSGIRFELLQSIVDFANCDEIYPFIPEAGSLGASGDLSPLSHIALNLMGEGKCYYKDELIDAKTALDKAGLKPIELAAKEGLALNNGMQWSNAFLAWNLYQIEKRANLGLVFAGLMSEIMMASDLPFTAEIHELRPYPGQAKAAAILKGVFAGSKIRKAHESFDYDVNVQDPYSSRCLPQVYGPLFDAMDETKKKLEIEMNSATDNPLVFDDMVISGGNFHGMPLSIAAANLFNAFCGTVAINMSLVRRIVDKDKNRLGVSCLISPEANHSISSGMMILEYSHTAHGNLLLSKNNTAFLHAQSSASHQEDHVSHAPTVILNMRDAIELHSVQLALQAAIIRQGYYVLEKMEDSWKDAGKIPQDSKMEAGTTGKTLIENMQNIFPVVSSDRYMQEEVEKVRLDLIETDKLYDALV